MIPKNYNKKTKSKKKFNYIKRFFAFSLWIIFLFFLLSSYQFYQIVEIKEKEISEKFDQEFAIDLKQIGLNLVDKESVTNFVKFSKKNEKWKKIEDSLYFDQNSDFNKRKALIFNFWTYKDRNFSNYKWYYLLFDPALEERDIQFSSCNFYDYNLSGSASTISCYQPNSIIIFLDGKEIEGSNFTKFKRNDRESNLELWEITKKLLRKTWAVSIKNSYKSSFLIGNYFSNVQIIHFWNPEKQVKRNNLQFGWEAQEKEISWKTWSSPQQQDLENFSSLALIIADGFSNVEISTLQALANDYFKDNNSNFDLFANRRKIMLKVESNSSNLAMSNVSLTFFSAITSKDCISDYFVVSGAVVHDLWLTRSERDFKTIQKFLNIEIQDSIIEKTFYQKYSLIKRAEVEINNLKFIDLFNEISLKREISYWKRVRELSLIIIKKKIDECPHYRIVAMEETPVEIKLLSFLAQDYLTTKISGIGGEVNLERKKNTNKESLNEILNEKFDLEEDLNNFFRSLSPDNFESIDDIWMSYKKLLWGTRKLSKNNLQEYKDFIDIEL